MDIFGRIPTLPSQENTILAHQIMQNDTRAEDKELGTNKEKDPVSLWFHSLKYILEVENVHGVILQPI